MVNFIRLIIIVLFLVGCTSDHYRFLSRNLGFHRVIGVFPIDLSNHDKHIFRMKWDGLTLGAKWHGYNMDLCVDSIPNASLFWTHGLNIFTKISIDDYTNEEMLDNIGIETTKCWWVNDSDGWYLLSRDFPVGTDLDKPFVIEFQIMEADSGGWSFFAKSGDDTSSIEHHIKDDDSLSLSRLKNPRLVVWTGS